MTILKGLGIGQFYCRSLVSGQRAIYALFNLGEFWELAMVQKAIASAIVELLIVALLCLGSGSVYAQQQNVEDFSKKYEKEVSKARTECSTLWSNHDFDSLRTRIPLGEEKPTFSMLKSIEKLSRKDRPLADLAIKTLEKCRKASEPVYAMLPPQVRAMLEGIQRRQDSKVAELYNGKITFGDFNVAMNGMSAEVSAAFSGLSTKADEAATSSASSSRSAQQSVSSNDKPASLESRMALVIGKDGMMAVRMQLKEDFGGSSLAADSRICLLPFASNGRIGSVPANGHRGNTSEDDADEASYGQHENRCNGEKPKRPKPFSILIGALIVAERREHRDLLVKSTGPV